MKIKYLKRIYEAIALLFMLVCVGQILWGAPNYDAQLSELKTAMNQSWQLENQKVAKDMANLKKSVRINGNSREGLDRLKRSQILGKKTAEINGILNQAHRLLPQYSADLKTVQTTVNNYIKWLYTEFKDLELTPLDPAQNLVKHLVQNHTSTVATQALISEYKLYIQRLQAMVLRQLGAEDIFISGCCGGTCRYIEAIPKVNKVQVGDDYQADMYYGANPTFTRVSCFLNNQALLAYDGYSKITFQPKKTGKQQLEVKVKYYDLLQDKKNTHVHKIHYEVK
jgi:hypothetical protein